MKKTVLVLVGLLVSTMAFASTWVHIGCDYNFNASNSESGSAITKGFGLRATFIEEYNSINFYSSVGIDFYKEMDASALTSIGGKVSGTYNSIPLEIGIAFYFGSNEKARFCITPAFGVNGYSSSSSDMATSSIANGLSPTITPYVSVGFKFGK